MVYEAHRNFVRYTRPPQPVDIGHAQAMETQMFLFDFDDELLPSARRLKWNSSVYWQPSDASRLNRV